MMKKNYLYALSVALLISACADRDLTDGPEPSSPADRPQVEIPADAVQGELLVKFVPEMSDILDRTMANTRASGGVATRSGIPSTDEVLDILGAYHFERIFPVDKRTEENARKAGLNLWYQVKFDEGTDLKEAYARIARLGEVSKLQVNHTIHRAYNPNRRARLLEPATLKAIGTARTRSGLPFNDERLDCQWNLINDGNRAMVMGNNTWAGVEAGCDLGAAEAWKKCTGNPEIIVAVLDEAVMYDHPDLAANMWVNESETFASNEDADGNGYKGDRYGFNFVKMTGNISYSSNADTGHGTHVAGIIAAVNNNGQGISSIAGGDGTPNSGVKIMSCQLFDGEYLANLANEAKAMKYAADNGAVILQCSWGNNSPESNPIMTPPGPGSTEEWAELYPLEKESIDYFVKYAGSPNGVIEGGIVIFAAGNESAPAPGYPGAYEKCISVGALAADYTPSIFTNYGKDVDISAPGGDSDYYGFPGYMETADDLHQGTILSTIVVQGQPGYAYMEGTSQACPAVSGVAALGLSYALQQRRHFTADEFRRLLLDNVETLDDKFAAKAEKKYHYNHVADAGNAQLLDLNAFRGKMGGMARADKLLAAIDGAGRDMIIPNFDLAPETSKSIDLSRYSAATGFSVESVENANIADVRIEGSLLTVKGLAVGSTAATILMDSQKRTITITVRKAAGGNGWM